MKKVCIIGSGYVGLVTGACLAEMGNRIICVDNDIKKVLSLKKGKIPIYEPGLRELIKKNKPRIKYSSSIRESVLASDIIFITVSTPPREDGSADLSAVERVATEIARSMSFGGDNPGYKLIIEKSTVPVETGEWVKYTIKRNLTKKVEFDVGSNPEFLREGQAIHDFFHPDRIVIGVETARSEKLLRELYSPIKAPLLVTDIKSAELIKHASNSFLATKISFINAVANICESVGADVTKVAEGMGLDRRIGKQFLSAGPGFGGSCFPKDLDAFYFISKKLGYDFSLLHDVRRINEEQKRSIIKKIEDALWIVEHKTIGILGLSFKPDTDDIRMAPAIDIIKELRAKNVAIKAYDPKAMDNVRKLFKGIKYCKNPYEAVRNTDCVILLTEWKEFENIDLTRVKRIMKQPVIIDARNMFEPGEMKKLGFIYKGVGR